MEETLGKRIMRRRKELGLTQDQLAEKLGVTAQAVSKWENDQSCPDINMLPRLAELFGTSTDALLGHAHVHEAEVVRDENREEKPGRWEVHWNAGRKTALALPVFVLLVGCLLLASRAMKWDVGFWSILLPSALLVFGLFSLLHRLHATNLVCTLLGGYFLVDNLGIFSISFDTNLIFPALIVLFGLSLLMDALRKPKKGRFSIKKNGSDYKANKHFTQEGEYFEASLNFGDENHQVTLPRLSGGRAGVSFGEMELDLTGCGEIADGCQIDVGVSFGELTVKVPCAYRVECEASASFGNISIHGHPQAEAKGVMELTGGVSFGEINIQYV